MSNLYLLRAILRANLSLIFLTLMLAGIGIANLYSASAVRIEDGMMINDYYQKQIYWFALGFVCLLAAMSFNYRRFSTLAWPIYVFSLLLLVAVLVTGVKINGAQRWIAIGGLNFQPGEFAKISAIILCAKLLAVGRDPLGWFELGKLFLCCTPILVLILLQPDLGTCLVVLLIVGGMLLFRGVKRSILKVGLVLMLVSPLILWQFVIPNLKSYQQDRIMSFINPDLADKKALHQNNQSRIAIGSGQMWGRGYLEGTQSKLRFLPEKHSDYAIAVFGEEWGFVGSAALVSVFCLFLAAIYGTVRDARDRFGCMIAVGAFFYFFWQIFINVGMVLGLMPVVGLPLTLYKLRRFVKFDELYFTGHSFKYFHSALCF